jgi:hypothetical protein
MNGGISNEELALILENVMSDLNESIIFLGPGCVV